MATVPLDSQGLVSVRSNSHRLMVDGISRGPDFAVQPKTRLVQSFTRNGLAKFLQSRNKNAGFVLEQHIKTSKNDED